MEKAPPTLSKTSPEPIFSPLYFWQCQDSTDIHHEKIEDESSLRACLKKLLVATAAQSNLAALFSKHPTAPLGWESWGGTFALTPDLPPLGDSFRTESYGTILHEGEQVPLHKLVPQTTASQGLAGRQDLLNGFSQLLNHKESGLHVLVASAGLGKSTVIDGILQSADLPPDAVYRSSFALGHVASLQTWGDLAGLELSPEDTPSEGFLDRLADSIADKFEHQDYSILILDDYHWVKPIDISMLRRLLLRVGSKLLVIIATRPEFDRDLLANFHPTYYELHPFTQGEVRELLHLQSPQLPNPEEAATILMKVAGGHPLLTTEIIRSPRFKESLPSLLDNLDGLSQVVELTRICEANPLLQNPEDRQALGFLAHLRKPFRAQIADQLIQASRLPGHWRKGLAAGVLQNGPNEHLSFRHALLQTAAQKWCPKSLAPERDKLIAKTLANEGDHAEASRHFAAAGEQQAALECHLKAAEYAFSQGELGATAEHALAALDQPTAPPNTDFNDHWRGGVALYILGRLTKATEILIEGLVKEKFVTPSSSLKQALVGWFATFLPSPTLVKKPEQIERYAKAIQALRIAAEAQWYQQDLSACITSGAKAVQLASKLPKDSYRERALSFVSAGLLYNMFAPRPWVRKVFLNAYRDGAQAKPDVRNEVAIIAGSYHMGQRDWHKARPILKASRLKSLKMGNRPLACRAATAECASLYFQGKLEELVEFSQSMYEHAKVADNLHLGGLLQMMRVFALADLEEPHLCLRTFLQIDPVMRNLHPFEFYCVVGSIGYLVNYNREESLQHIREGLERGLQQAHLSFGAPMTFGWLSDSLSLAVERGDLPKYAQDQFLKSVRKHSQFFPSARPMKSAILKVALAYRQHRQPQQKELASVLQEANTIRHHYTIQWLNSHLADPSTPPQFQGLARRCEIVRSGILS